MKVGSLIKYYRTKLGMTQSELVEGICSVPHLSKIENNGKEANTDTLNLLLNRLGVNLGEVEEKNINIKKLLDDWIEHINCFQIKEAEDIYQQLQGFTEFMAFTPHLFLYELYKLRYLLFIRDLEEAAQQFKWLEKQKSNMSYEELYLFNYYHSICLIMQNNYRKADELLLELVSSKGEGMHASGEVYYHLALVKCYIEQPGHSLFYAKKAITAFTSQYNLKRILHTLMIMGIGYTDSEIYEIAIDCFKHLKRNAEILGESSLLALTYHNIGYLNQKIGNLELAKEYYQKSLDYKTEDRESSLISLYTYAETVYQLGEYEHASKSFNKVKEEAIQLESKIYQILPNYYLYMIQNEEERAIIYLEEQTLPFLRSRNQYTNIRRVNKILVNYYLKTGMFEQAMEYIDKD